MIALYLHDPRREQLDRARALLAAFPDGSTVISPHSRPLGWTHAWTHLTDPGPQALVRLVEATAWTAVVVDGPAEHVAALAGRGVRLAVLAEPGGGTDGERGPAYAAADAILAPWAPLGLDATWPSAWRERTLHIGAVGHQAATSVPAARTPGRHSSGGRWHAVVLAPTGAGPGPRDRWAMAVETPAWRWTYAQEREVLEDGPVWAALTHCEVVVCAPTTATVAALAACEVPALLVLPERASRAQEFLAETAARTAPVVAVRNWPQPEEWRFLLDRVRSLDGKAWSTWSPADGVAEAVAFLTEGSSPAAEPALLSPA